MFLARLTCFRLCIVRTQCRLLLQAFFTLSLTLTPFDFALFGYRQTTEHTQPSTVNVKPN